MAFLREHGRIVVKPLRWHGRPLHLRRRTPSDKNTNVIFETLTDYGQRFAIVQRYIPEIVESGDARVLLVDGEPCPTRWRAFRPPRTTAATSPQAPRASAGPLTDRERWLAGEIGPALAGKGMLFVGLDVIGGYVTEINVTSPTGVRELDKQFNLDIGGQFIDAILRRKLR